MQKQYNIKRAHTASPEGGSMKSVEVTDLYEAAYLLVQGGRIEGVQCIPLSSSLGCTFTIRGEGLEAEQDRYRRKEAAANLYAFRGAYTQVNGFMHEAKKAFERERRQLRRDGV
jgi:hypothetical protein